jgi:hypothetical protein
MAEVKAAGKYRQEGKTYQVQARRRRARTRATFVAPRGRRPRARGSYTRALGGSLASKRRRAPPRARTTQDALPTPTPTPTPQDGDIIHFQFNVRRPGGRGRDGRKGGGVAARGGAGFLEPVAAPGGAAAGAQACAAGPEVGRGARGLFPWCASPAQPARAVPRRLGSPPALPCFRPPVGQVTAPKKK